jgi:hypothetical protein
MTKGQQKLWEEPKPEPESRKRDEIWDTLEYEFGPVLTKTERGRRNRAVRELREAGLTPEQIRVGLDYCRRNFATYTEMAVCGWISRALHEHQQMAKSESFENVIAIAMRRNEL